MSRLALAVQQYWMAELAELQSLPQAVYDRQPEAIHDLRAAGRRIKSTLRTFRPLIRAPLASAVSGELDWYSHFLGEARDAEVILGNAAGLLSGRPGAEQILIALSAERTRTLLRAESLLTDPRTAALLDQVQELTAEPWRSGRHGRGPRSSDLLGRVAWATSRMAADWSAGPRWGESRAGWQHRVRRRAKSVRYANESLSRQLPELSVAAAGFAKVAALLGIIQDTAVLNRVLAHWPAYLVGEAIAVRTRMAAEAERAVDVAIRNALATSDEAHPRRARR